MCCRSTHISLNSPWKLAAGKFGKRMRVEPYASKRNRVSMNADPNTEGDAAWLHERFTLESLNPDYKSWDVASVGTVRVLGEFLFVV
jgi:hypothetical protein